MTKEVFVATALGYLVVVIAPSAWMAPLETGMEMEIVRGIIITRYVT